MIELMDVHSIIKLKKEGYSNRAISNILHINRKTIAKYWNEYSAAQDKLKTANKTEVLHIQENICAPPSYDSSTRRCRKYTNDMDALLDEILLKELEKTKYLKTKKQQLTQLQIYEIIKDAGFDISISTITNKIREKRDSHKECFIKQTYDYGDRLEYDFGEVKLIINGELGTYHIAVLSSPASNFRWAYLYKNQKQDVFMDSHVRFFEMMQGVFKETVYDNMKNVVTRFIGRNEKCLNEKLLSLSLYYGFDINVTNCFSGNEKGHVEGSVKIIRNKVFSKHYCFNSYEDACTFLNNQLVELNKNSTIEDEKVALLPYKPKLELAELRDVKVNKYSFIRIDNNFYSVPEYLVDKQIQAKIYFDKIVIFSNLAYVCEHKKIDGVNEISIDIHHYLNTFTKKPGALRNSEALKSIPLLKSIYDSHFIKNPKKFIELLKENNDKDLNSLLEILNGYTLTKNKIIEFKNLKDRAELGKITRNQITMYNHICIGGEKNDYK